MSKGKCEKVFEGHTEQVLYVEFSPNGKNIVSCSCKINLILNKL